MPGNRVALGLVQKESTAGLLRGGSVSGFESRTAHKTKRCRMDRKNISRETFFRLLDNCYMWDLMPTEKALAVEMAMEYGGNVILQNWEEYQELFPGMSFFRFENWFLSVGSKEPENKQDSDVKGEKNGAVSVPTVGSTKSLNVELW